MREGDRETLVLLLRWSGCSVVVGTHPEAAAVAHSWALEAKKRGRGGGDERKRETPLVFEGSQQARSEGRAGC